MGEHGGEVVHRGEGAGVGDADGLRVGFQDAAVEGFGGGEVALVVQGGGEVVHGAEHAGGGGALVEGFSGREDFVEERGGFGVFALFCQGGA